MYDLMKVSKPLRYTGGEMGMIKKDPADKLNLCLVFPDIYEIGMSHLGFKILYTNLNKSEKVVCERFFAPWPDAMEAFGSEIMVSLENRTHLSKFDVVGFSFQYELSYVTALQLLKASGIGVKSSERKENEPIVIAGGGCVLNPAPLSEFIDVFFLGEMDEAVVKVMEELYELRKKGVSRKEQLEMLNKFPFTYVPSVEPQKRAKREIYTGFSKDTSSPSSIVPIMPIIQDRVAVEIARGCTNGCRFCQAGMIYRPVREKTVANLCESSINSINKTGFQELSLLSLDTGDYSQIEPLLDKLGTALISRKISFSLPSLRAETVNPAIFEKIGAVRKSGFTIAPEAGTQKLRDIINKNLTEEEIINAAIYAKNAEYKGVKLYFMCGLPYETDEDILGIAELARKIRNAVKGGKYFDITVSVSNFVPKPHTPFERFGQNSVEELNRKHMLLKDELRRDKGIKLKYHDSLTSSIEACIARGDKRVGELLYKAVEERFYLDAWSEFFHRDAWVRLFEDNGYSIEDFACKTWSDEEILPWNMVNCGIDDDWMSEERLKASNGETTADCRKDSCSNCGVCAKDIKNTSAEADDYTPPKAETAENFIKYEMKYEKKGISAFMSALDLSRIFAHILLSNNVKLKFTEGFNPMPRIVLQAPIPAGVSGKDESVLFEADLKGVNIDELVEKINLSAPEGLIAKSILVKAWPKNLANYKMKFHFNKESFDFLMNRYKDNSASYEKLDKKGKLKVVSLESYLIDTIPEENTLEVQVSELGGFHFPEFFRKSGYEDKLEITRVSLKPIITE